MPAKFVTTICVSFFEGLLPPERVTFVPLQVNAKVTGVVSVNLEIAIDGADYNPLVSFSPQKVSFTSLMR